MGTSNHAVRSMVGLGMLASFMVVTAGSAASLASASSTPAPAAADIPEMLARIADRACPVGMARVGANCVDKYEGSLVEISEDGTESAWSPYEPPNGHHVRAVSRPGVIPQAHISMVEAKRA